MMYSRESIDWEARDDARTLARAEEIRADKPRTLKASKEAVRMLEEKEEELRGIKKVAKGTPLKQTQCQRSGRTTVKGNTNSLISAFPRTPAE